MSVNASIDDFLNNMMGEPYQKNREEIRADLEKKHTSEEIINEKLKDFDDFNKDVSYHIYRVLKGFEGKSIGNIMCILKCILIFFFCQDKIDKDDTHAFLADVSKHILDAKET